MEIEVAVRKGRLADYLKHQSWVQYPVVKSWTSPLMS